MFVRKFMLVIVAAMSFATILHGRDILTRSGDLLKDVSVTKIEQTGIRISHRDGARFVDFKDLPADIQKEFGFNEQLYAAAVAATTDRVALLAVQRRATVAAIESQRLADIESAAEQARQLAAAKAALASQPPPDTSIAQRNYGARSYAARDSAARDYTQPRYVAPPAYVPPPSSSGTVQVRGYFRKNGTYVSGYTRRK